MVNWGAFSRDFVGGFKAGADVVLRADEAARRNELAQAAEKRSQSAEGRAAGRYAMEQADRAAEDAYFSGQGVGEKAAAAYSPPSGGSGGRSRAMAIPNKLGAVTETGEPIPASPEEAAAADEVASTAEAVDRGYTPAPPAKVGANRRAIEGDNPQPRAEALPAPGYKGRITPAIARDMREREEQRINQRNKDRDYGLRREAQDQDIKTSAQALDKATFEQKLVKAQEFSKQAYVLGERLKGKENLRVTDSSVAPLVAQVKDTLMRGYAETPDGRSLDVKETPDGLAVTQIDERTGKPIGPPDLIRTVADLQDATLMFGQITQGENMGKWVAAASGDAIRNQVRGTQGEAEVNKFMDGLFSASAEQRLDPKWQAETSRKMRELEAKYPEFATEPVEVPVMDPEDPSKPLLDLRTGRPVTEKKQVSRFAKVGDLLQPNTNIKGPDGQEMDARQLIQNVLRDPSRALKKVGGDPQAMLVALREQLTSAGLEEDVADALVQQAANNLPAALQQLMAALAMPQSVNALGPQEQARMVGPSPAQPAGLPVDQRRAIEPGVPDTRVRRPVPPVQVDPNARRIGSPFAR